MKNKATVKQAISSLKISGYELGQESDEMLAKITAGEMTTEDVRRITGEK
jgi:hypothetical protein